jgi:uncharacterized protein YyaL (SSP411 family)
VNRLSSETSPYLLQHAANPVEWYPWGEEAFRRAREEDKPVFLSIGYAACHWCHVMAHESFDDDATAAVLNRDFISVKVDREERPDVDTIYMDAVVALTGQGGWPLSVFLTPDGEPFFGGTYFPPRRTRGMPAFTEVLEGITAAWRGDRARLRETSRRLTEHITAASSFSGSNEAIDPALETAAMEGLLRSYDWDHGGWGGAPKFPQAGVVAVLLRRHQRTGDRMALDMAAHALTAMAGGGLFDHVGGGFHRYAVDRTWTVPHFEKMLYDNALLARAYLEAWQVTGRLDFLKTADATLTFLRRELGNSRGGFSASLDADSEGEEGRFYTWTIDEIRSALDDPDAFGLVQRAFDLPPEGHLEGRIVLRRKEDDPGIAQAISVTAEDGGARLTAAASRLLAARSARVRPALDDKVVTAWNGLALSAWAAASRILRRPEDLATAQSLADFLLTALRPSGRLHRSWREGSPRQPAFLDDHASLANGLLDLYQVDFDERWLDASRELAEEILVRFTDAAGGFFDTPHDHASLVARPKSVQDAPIPSGNALAVLLLLRLEAVYGEARYREAALPPLAAMQATAARHPTAFATWLEALTLAADPLPQLAIVGAREAEGFQALAAEAHRRFLPRLVLAGGESGDGGPSLLRGRPMIDGRPTAFLCRGFTCRAPTASPSVLAEQLREVR